PLATTGGWPRQTCLGRIYKKHPQTGLGMLLDMAVGNPVENPERSAGRRPLKNSRATDDHFCPY
ncbi:MAG: hypothetical protein AB1746_11930, partial [Candidatus Zixiibacteriota bacterium]